VTLRRLALVFPLLLLAAKHTNPVTKEGAPNIQAAAAVLVDLDAGQEIYAKNADDVRPIASVGKLFLALALRDKNIPLDGKTTITDEDRKFAEGGARSRLLVGKTFTNHDLLRAMLIASDNRACTALGRGAGMTPAELVAAMNEEAQKLGLVHTKFTDPSGVNGNVSTPREVLLALKAALDDPVISEVLSTPKITIQSVDAKNPISVEYSSTDLALRAGKYTVLGGKTGYTDDAKYCLAIAASFSGKKVGMVFLGAEGKLTRFADFNRVAEWFDTSGGKLPVAPTIDLHQKGVGALIDPPHAPLTPLLVQ
jgi:D-alanyl-D-alanine endopeptidase (penicillin-binding protein 7)